MLGFLCDEQGKIMNSSSNVMTVVMTTNENNLIGPGMMMAVRLGKLSISMFLYISIF